MRDTIWIFSRITFTAMKCLLCTYRPAQSADLDLGQHPWHDGKQASSNNTWLCGIFGVVATVRTAEHVENTFFVQVLTLKKRSYLKLCKKTFYQTQSTVKRFIIFYKRRKNIQKLSRSWSDWVWSRAVSRFYYFYTIHVCGEPESDSNARAPWAPIHRSLKNVLHMHPVSNLHWNEWGIGYWYPGVPTLLST